MKNIVNFPPSWCPDAVPSDRGWRHPVTGELLVSVRGGVKPLPKVEEQLVEVPSAKAVISEVVKEAVIDETVQGEAVIEDEQPVEVIAEDTPKAKRRGRGKNAV
jgi:hypothetical protein